LISVALRRFAPGAITSTHLTAALHKAFTDPATSTVESSSASVPGQVGATVTAGALIASSTVAADVITVAADTWPIMATGVIMAIIAEMVTPADIPVGILAITLVDILVITPVVLVIPADTLAQPVVTLAEQVDTPVERVVPTPYNRSQVAAVNPQVAAVESHPVVVDILPAVTSKN
jgi:hypothetical protein